ncbi:MAG: hypothetical protein MZV63_52185 [Marinilabiliales bacterium]|nr:hypothetical protein [Marinilabiliales bacterium]
MNGIGWEASVQFMAPLPENRFINAGLTYTPSLNLKTTNRGRYIQVFKCSDFQLSPLTPCPMSLSVPPAVFRRPSGQASPSGRTISLPQVLISSTHTWSEASLPGTYGTYADVISLHAGAEYIPDKFSNYSFFDRMEYRIGCRYGESYALYEGRQRQRIRHNFWNRYTIEKIEIQNLLGCGPVKQG